MEEEKLTKKERKALRRLEALDKQKEENKPNILNWLVISICALLVLGLFVFIVNKGKQSAAIQAQIAINQNSHITGNKDAKTTLVEYSDFQCPACANAQPAIRQILKNDSKNLRFAYKHFPLPSHKNALAAALAAEAAGKQNRFWEMHDILFQKQNEWADLAGPREIFVKYAQGLNLDTIQFGKDMDSQELKDKINNDAQEAIKNGVDATPTFYLNNKKMEISTYEGFIKDVESQIQK